jgi:tRNA threonylcarbamoyladenosine biosynthesis protein TsaB
MSLHWLSVDTSMNACAVGVKRADGQMFELSERMDRGQSERLMPMILEVLAQAGLTLADIDAYAVTHGPGTFTGLRVGLATVRALAQVSGKPVIGVGTFEALAMAVPARPLCVLIETKRQDYYTRLFVDGIEHAGACLSPDDLRAFLKPDWVLAGDALTRAKQETGCTNECIELIAPALSHIIAIAAAQLEAGGGSTLPEPLYLRPADVSVSKKQAARIV